MDKDKIVSYIFDREEVSVPEIQIKFGLGYKEIREYVQSLCDNGKLIFCEDELHFRKTDKFSEKEYEDGVSDFDFDNISDLSERIKAAIKSLQNVINRFGLPSFYKIVLKEIAEKKKISISQIQRKCNVGFASAGAAAEWFLDRGLLKPANRGYVINDHPFADEDNDDDDNDNDDFDDFDDKEEDDDDNDDDEDNDDGDEEAESKRIKTFNTEMCERICYDEIEIIVKANEKITKDELVETLKKNLENKAYNMIDFKPLIEKINNLSEEEFDEIKVIILS